MDYFSNQSALFRANQTALFRANQEIDNSSLFSNGTWYKKAPLNNDRSFSAAKIVPKVNVHCEKADEVKESLFHFLCVCKLCREVKRPEEIGPKVAECYAKYCNSDEENFPPMARGSKMCNPVKKEVNCVKSSKEKKIKQEPVRSAEKSSSILSSNRFSVLTLDVSGDEPEKKFEKMYPSVNKNCNNSKKKSVKNVENLSSSMFGNEDVPVPCRGGAKNEKDVFVKSIDIAKKHGISLSADKSNPGKGDCLFESIIDNVNHRDCFQESLEDNVDCYRELWVTELEEMYKLKEVYPGFGGKSISDETLSEWTAAWVQQKNPGEYNVDQFNVSDLTPLGLGHCVNRNVLVFSTDVNEPVTVFPANYFVKELKPKSEVPVVIAYDSQNLHYESLLPQGEDDIVKCIRLVKSVQSGTYDKVKPKLYLKKSNSEKKALKAEADRKRNAGKSDLDRAKDAKRKCENRINESAEAKQARLDQSNESRAGKRKNCHENMFKLGECENIEPFSVGKMNKVCKECGAYMFAGETHKGSLGETSEPGTATFSLCCSYGKVKIAPLQEMPPVLKSLLKNDDSESKEFRTNIRDYNNALSFSSRGFSGKPFEFTSRGPQVFKVSGQMYHCMGNVLPNDGDSPQFSQMYVYDEQHELDNRMKNVKGLRRDTLEKLQHMMHEENPWVKVYKSAADVMKENETVDVQMLLKARSNENSKKVFKFPSVQDVGIIIPNRADNDLKNPRDVLLYKNQMSNPKGNVTERISSLHRAYDPTAYPILFPKGDYGFELEGEKTTDNKKLNTLKYYQQRLMVFDPDEPSIHSCGRLFQEYLCDMYSKIEAERLFWHERNQAEIRAEQYDGLADAIENNDDKIGKEVKLPSSFVLSQRWMYAHYLDALAIARKYRKFSWFITVTCNPQSAEILESCNGQLPANRPDIVDRVFFLQMKEFLHDLYQKQAMGIPLAWVHVFERQMRGLWHCHISLLTKGVVPEGEIDNWVSAMLPDEDSDPEYHKLVVTHMLHGPCGASNPNSPCMVKNVDGKKVCKAGYPKQWNAKTYLQPNGYPVYCRKNDGRTYVKKDFKYDNRWVVPHNRAMLLRHKCHVNVEYTASLSTVRYQFKYTHKGTDLATVELLSKKEKEPKNEIQLYVNSRFIDSHLAVGRICEFNLQDRYPSVIRLDIHDENKQFVYFRPGQEIDKVSNPKKTKLTAWMEYNKSNVKESSSYDEDADKYTYMEFPEHYTFVVKNMCWKKRARESKNVSCIGRIHAVPRSSDDRYYLRMLLHHKKGATSFQDVRTYQSVVYDTYKAAANAMGLLSDDKEIVYAMQETSDFGNAEKLRNLFAIILNFGEVANPKEIFEQFRDELSSDIEYEKRKSCDTVCIKDVVNSCLIKLDDILQDMGSSMAQFADMPQPNLAVDTQSETRAFRRERYNEFEQSSKLDSFFEKLQSNENQSSVFKRIVTAVDEGLSRQFVINAPGGYGKTFLFECISTYVRSKGLIALCCASTGIAAWNMEGGRTAHSMFKIPINADQDSTSEIRAQSSEAAVIREASIILWDEIFNVHQHNILVVERLLRDVMQNKLPWGGKVIVFGGDPRQTPPVVTKGKRGETVAASFKSCPLYSTVEEFMLTKNMRVQDEAFCEWILKIGNGTISSNVNDQWVNIPDVHKVKTKLNLIEKTFPNLEKNDQDELMNSGIFCPTNDDAWDINQICLNKLPSEAKTYLSYDRVEDDDCVSGQTELLNSRRPSGFPDHNLILKAGCPVMLLRNLQCGLVNGTRMVVKVMHVKVLECEVMVGHRKGETVFIPRIPLYDRSADYPWTMIRVQFPVRVCYAMTIHKGQGQSLDRVGVYIAQQMFAHGQLYVALSRVKKASGLHVLLEGESNFVRNIVYKEIL